MRRGGEGGLSKQLAQGVVGQGGVGGGQLLVL